MSGTKIGGSKASKTNKERHGENFFAEIGRTGGQKSSPTKGFGSNKKLASQMGSKMGKLSKKGYTIIEHNTIRTVYRHKVTNELLTISNIHPYKTLKKVLVKVI